MKDCGSLQDKEIRESLINDLEPTSYLEEVNILFKIFKKEKFSYSDLLRIHFAFSETEFINYTVNKSLYNYKMKRISVKRIEEFAIIVKKECPWIKIDDEITYRDLFWWAGNSFEKLVNIFLDEI